VEQPDIAGIEFSFKPLTIYSKLKIHFMAEMNNHSESSKKSVRGFAAMDAEKQREIARKGGRAAHEQGVAHEWSSEEARQAGKKGGQARGRSSSNGEGPLL
jgi:general stress protein YciG